MIFADKVADGAHPGVDSGLGLERRQPLYIRGEQPAVQTGVPRAVVLQTYGPTPKPAAQQQLQVGLEKNLHHGDAALQCPNRQGQDPQNAKRQSTEMKSSDPQPILYIKVSSTFRIIND